MEFRLAESGPAGFAKPRYVTVRLPKTHRKFVVKLARVRKKYNTVSADTARVIVLLFSYLLLYVYTGVEQFCERGLDSDERIYGTRMISSFVASSTNLEKIDG